MNPEFETQALAAAEDFVGRALSYKADADSLRLAYEFLIEAAWYDTTDASLSRRSTADSSSQTWHVADLSHAADHKERERALTSSRVVSCLPASKVTAVVQVLATAESHGSLLLGAQDLGTRDVVLVLLHDVSLPWDTSHRLTHVVVVIPSVCIAFLDTSSRLLSSDEAKYFAMFHSLPPADAPLMHALYDTVRFVSQQEAAAIASRGASSSTG
jgi:hypothetical protein